MLQMRMWIVQVLGKEWAQTALDFQEKVHRVAVTILKALFIALGRDEAIIDNVSHRVFLMLLHPIDCLTLICSALWS